MTRVEYLPEVADDFKRFVAHMARYGVPDPTLKIAAIVEAVKILTHSPLIGRPVRRARRELVIGKDEYGYVVLYRYAARTDAVVVLAIKSQRERGYKRRSSG